MKRWMGDLIDLKKEAINSKDYDIYLGALKVIQITFSKMYSESKMKEALQLEESILKMVTGEIKWVNKKKKEKEIPF